MTGLLRKHARPGKQSRRQRDAHAWREKPLLNGNHCPTTKGFAKGGDPYLTGAVSGAAEVAGVVIAVSLVLRLQPSAVLVSNHRPIMLHTADCTILGAAATGLCTGFPRTHLGPTVMQFI